MKPIFTIIIPAYNVENYIGIAIESCINQKNIAPFEYEIIVINDGSSDNTQGAMDKYRHINNVLLVSKENEGLSVTRNKGVELANGDYILFLDGDDWFHEDTLFTLKGYIGKADLIIFPMVYYYTETNQVYNSLNLISNHVYTPKELLRKTIGSSQFQSCPAPIKCYQASIFKDNHLRFIEGILHEDGPFYLEVLASVKSILYVDKFLYFYRQQRMGSITTEKHTWKNIEGIIIGQQNIFNVYQFSNKDVNYYYLASSILLFFQKYKSEEDYLKLKSYFSKVSTRKFLFRSLCSFRFHFQSLLFAIFIIIAPSIFLRLILFIKGNSRT